MHSHVAPKITAPAGHKPIWFTRINILVIDLYVLRDHSFFMGRGAGGFLIISDKFCVTLECLLKPVHLPA